MSPVLKSRYIHSLIALIVTIRRAKLMIDELEQIANNLKEDIVLEDQLDMFK